VQHEKWTRPTMDCLIGCLLLHMDTAAIDAAEDILHIDAAEDNDNAADVAAEDNVDDDAEDDVDGAAEDDAANAKTHTAVPHTFPHLQQWARHWHFHSSPRSDR